MQVALSKFNHEFKPRFKPDADGTTPPHLQLASELTHSWRRSDYHDFLAERRR